jgi:hypothetical protein
MADRDWRCADVQWTVSVFPAVLPSESSASPRTRKKEWVAPLSPYTIEISVNPEDARVLPSGAEVPHSSPRTKDKRLRGHLTAIEDEGASWAGNPGSKGRPRRRPKVTLISFDIRAIR